MIIDIHCDLCIWMAHHILHNFGIDIVLTQSGTSRMTKGMRWNRRHQLRLSLLFFCQFAFFLIIGINNVFQKAVHSRRHDRTSMLCIKDESTASTYLYITLQTKHQVQFSLLTERIIYHLCHRNISDSCIRFGFWIMETISFFTFIIHKLSTYMDLPILHIHIWPG